MWLAVTVLEIAPLLADPAAAVATAVIDRYGPYLCWMDADASDVEVFTEHGDWVGTAPEPNDLTDLIDAFERWLRRWQRGTFVVEFRQRKVINWLRNVGENQ